MTSSSVKRDYYEVLGVPRESTPDQIKAAYRKLALKHHPDRNKSPGAEERFKEISEAYAVLSDDQKRTQYDQFGHEGIGGQEDIFRTTNFDDVFRDMGFGGGFDSTFKSFFGGGFDGSRRRRYRSEREQRGEDLTYEIDLTLEEIASGTTKEIAIPRNETCGTCKGTGASPGSSPKTCPSCRGSGQMQNMSASGFSRLIRIFTCETCKGRGKVVDNPCRTCGGNGLVERTRKVAVKIPPGVEDGSSLRLREEGNLGEEAAGGGRPGDLYIVCRELPHKFFKRDGDDLHTELSIDMVDAALGTEIPVSTIEGKTITLKVPAGTQSGTTFRLKGMGIPSLGNVSRRGNEFVTVIVNIPTKLSPRQTEILKKFKETEKRK